MIQINHIWVLRYLLQPRTTGATKQKGAHFMTLEHLWFVTLILISIIFSAIASRQSDSYSDFSLWKIAAHIAALMSIIISWNGIGAALLRWFLINLPQGDTAIITLLAGAFIFTTGVLIVIGVPYATISGSIWLIEKRKKK